MASTTNHLDIPITLKVNYDGATRRYKLPLRDLNVNVLENKVSKILTRLLHGPIYLACATIDLVIIVGAITSPWTILMLRILSLECVLLC